MTHPESYAQHQQPTDHTLSRRATLGLLGTAAVSTFALPASARGDRRTEYFEPATYSVVDVDGESPPFSRATQLYDAYVYDPDEPETAALLTPDGHSVTWDRFSDVNGSVTLECFPKGTRVTLYGWDLIPRGLYTVWVAILDGDTVVGSAPLGANDGSQSAFRASGGGRGDLSVLDLPGPLTADLNDDPAYETYVTPTCLLDSEFAVEIAGAYHYDDVTHGAEPRPNAVEHFSVLF
jgi:hypothetical protein